MKYSDPPSTSDIKESVVVVIDEIKESIPIRKESSPLSQSPSRYRRTEVTDCTREKSNELLVLWNF